ncbi:uncharacterized protein A1O5_10850 [Cladophialophora psammophila CBS 110553]|uniref:PrpF protein n=1 Tax=Cladophialophora psammophila CBS 110553 TaxID=1182543 RepID=W9X712_9EURO|nr:uncharacterized protein A1O5_10850 [Cladophialophora psammophila CBS 110553]EXJ66234.1 hypothetical protein A1O5_10850 [Cladophialophora psammophila CBS 110553]
MDLETDSDQIAIPAVYMRGGSSKAIFFHARDIPPAGKKRDRLLKRIIGAPDPLQIDGMGGAKAITSKMAIISESRRDMTDVDYEFVQVGVADDEVKYNMACGNISAAVGPFAVDEGLIKTFREGKGPPTPSDSTTSQANGLSGLAKTQAEPRYQEIRIYNTSTEKNFIAHIPVNANGKSVSKGKYQIAAVPGSGAPIMLDYRETLGAALNKGLFPTGNPKDEINMSNGRRVGITISDAGNICVFALARDLDITGHESASELTRTKHLIRATRELRGRAAQMVGMCADWNKVDEQSPFLPMPVLIADPTHRAGSGAHVCGRLFLDNMCHESMAGTGSVSFAAASRVVGSVVYNLIGADAAKETTLNIEHPMGIMPIAVEVDMIHEDGGVPRFLTLSFIRTARRLMDGSVYVPAEVFEDEEASVDA